MRPSSFGSSRREFLRTSVAGGAILALPASTYSTVFAAEAPPSERVRIGVIGVGGQGKGNMGAYLGHKFAQVTAICDVDSERREAAVGIAEKKLGGAPWSAGDFRKLLDSKDVDAVVVSTPDHWHALPTILACQAGKDV